MENPVHNSPRKKSTRLYFPPSPPSRRKPSTSVDIEQVSNVKLARIPRSRARESALTTVVMRQATAVGRLMSQRVGDHFRIHEFEDRRSDKPIPLQSLGGLVLLVRRALDPLRDAFGVTRVSSGYRSEESNTAAGGALYSHHVWNNHPWSPAADVVPTNGTPADWVRFLDLISDGWGIGQYSGHVHVDLRTDRARWTG